MSNNNNNMSKTHQPGHRTQRKSIAGITSFPPKHFTGRQHTSNSISVTNPASSSTAAVTSSSLKNANTCSTSTLVSSTNGTMANNASSNNSSAVSSQNQSTTTATVACGVPATGTALETANSQQQKPAEPNIQIVHSPTQANNLEAFKKGIQFVIED